MIILYDGMQESNQDVKIYCPTLKGGYYIGPWVALNPVYENENFFYLEGVGDEEIRQATMLEF